MKIRVDFFKPSGKWYAGGVVDMQATQAWHIDYEKLKTLWSNQDILKGSIDKRYWTIVTDDLPEAHNDPEYKTCWKQILQIGKEN